MKTPRQENDDFLKEHPNTDSETRCLISFDNCLLFISANINSFCAFTSSVITTLTSVFATPAAPIVAALAPQATALAEEVTKEVVNDIEQAVHNDINERKERIEKKSNLTNTSIDQDQQNDNALYLGYQDTDYYI